MAVQLPHEPTAAEVALRQALDRSERERHQLVTVLDQWAESSGRQVLRILDMWCDWAENPRDPRQPAARKLVDAWVATQRRAERIAAGLVVAAEVPPPGNGAL